MWTDRRTDMMKLILAFRKFAKAPEKVENLCLIKLRDVSKLLVVTKRFGIMSV